MAHLRLIRGDRLSYRPGRAELIAIGLSLGFSLPEAREYVDQDRQLRLVPVARHGQTGQRVSQFTAGTPRAPRRRHG